MSRPSSPSPSPSPPSSSASTSASISALPPHLLQHPHTFDPTSPGSQILSRPAGFIPSTTSSKKAEEEDSPFTDPDAIPPSPPPESQSQGQSQRQTISALPTRFLRKSETSLASSTPTLGAKEGKKEWIGQSMLLDPLKRTSAAGISGGTVGGVGQSFMHLLNALSLKKSESLSDEDSGDDDAGGKPIESETSTATSTLDDDISSSIYAIHKPIEDRRKAIGDDTDEEDEDEENGAGKGKGKEEVTALQRKKKLADKLADIFGLEKEEEVLAEYQCWLFRSVLLQGFIYVTSGHICFYAYLTQKEGTILRSERLSARGSRTRRYYRHWFILKDDVLSWYPSSSEPYFPDGHIDLHYCISVEPSASHPTHFKVATAERKWHFSADSEVSRDEWVKLLRKIVFRCQNEGESVKIAIPLETIIDIERSANLEFAETIRIRVYDADEGYSIDEYWLSYFVDLAGALEQMQSALEEFRKKNPQAERAAGLGGIGPGGLSRVETTLGHSKTPSTSSLSGGFTGGASLGTRVSQGSTIKRTPTWTTALSTRLRLFSTSGTDRSSQSVATLTDKEATGSVTPRTEGSRSPGPRKSFSRPTSPQRRPTARRSFSDGSSTSSVIDDGSVIDGERRQSLDEHTYPPEPSSADPPPELALSEHTPKQVSAWQVPSMITLAATVPEWLKSRKINPITKVVVRKISEVVSRSALDGAEGKREEHEERERGSIEEREEKEDEEERGDEKFRKSFGLTEKEKVVAYHNAYLFRGLPIYGKLYISTSFFCFRSVGLSNSLLPKTTMILPLSDILAVSKHRSFRIGYSGLIVIIKGHEEIFFELQSPERRDACIQQIEQQADLVRTQIHDGKAPGDSREYQQHLELLKLAASKDLDEADPDGRFPTETSAAGQPPVMFCSTSSDFITFRPEKSLKFTCLTIGSRGDVQPYIALCKGLMAEGHTCKIASHAEYRTWVEGHGIAFEAIGGDPAQLMQLMIAHDFFTIAFMKEAVGHFRGWLDDLLETTWLACQGADVLIESPSAIAGYHIAEALQIPYYRAFTMPWSRTRAYPHAFAVPDHKLGGGYNFMTYTMFDHIFWRATSSQVNRWRKKTLHIRPTSLEAMQQQRIPFLYNFSPVVVPPPLDWRENIHVTGYWWLDNPDDSKAKKWEPPADLLEFLDKAKAEDKKVIFIGFGSIIIPDPQEMTRIVTEAVEKSGVFAVIAKGWSDRIPSSAEGQLQHEAQEKEEAQMLLRPYIYNVKSIPHDWLFPRIHAAVHHGGAGTTGASLRAGLPTIIKPFFGDQHFYADRVATLGIGSAIRHMSVEALTAAIITAVTDEKQISRAKLAGEAISKEDGVGKAIECIYRDLEYARSLIPPPPVAKGAVVDSSATPQPDSPILAGQSFHARSDSAPATRLLPDRRLPSASASSKNGSSDAEWDVLSGGSGAEWDRDESRGSSVAGKRPASSRGDGDIFSDVGE